MSGWRAFACAALMLLAVACKAPPGEVAAGAAAPLGLPATPGADGPAPGRAAVDLGRKLFMDRRLSHNNTMSCGMCHVPEQGFTSNEMGAAIGHEGRSLRRNAPTIFNVAYVKHLFHDGRESTLENQAWGPLLNGNEMANPSIGYVIDKIRAMPDYHGRFEAAFGGRGPTVETIGAALAAYERTVVSGDARFDRWRFGGQDSALTLVERAGFQLFTGKAGCAACHTVGERTALFSDDRFHNTGIGWARSMGTGRARHKVQLAPGVTTEIDDSVVQTFSEPQQGDVGRYEVTLDPADSWAYRTPGLRNVALTAPYMHDGSMATLAEVVEFYDRGGIDNPHKDPLLKPLHLSKDEKEALVAFLGTLTGSNARALEADARAAFVDGKLPERQP